MWFVCGTSLSCGVCSCEGVLGVVIRVMYLHLALVFHHRFFLVILEDIKHEPVHLFQVGPKSFLLKRIR